MIISSDTHFDLVIYCVFVMYNVFEASVMAPVLAV